MSETPFTTTEPSDAAINAARQTLTKWHTPQHFASAVESFARLVKSATLFNKPNVGFLLDAIPIAEFTKHRAVDSVRLVEQSERLNDGQFKKADEIIDVEVTEALAPGRKRGDEYRSGRANVTHHDFDPKLGETISIQLANAVKKKAAKGYPSKPLLLVYLNIGTGGRLGNEVEKTINELKAQYADNFHEICVLWAGKLY